MVPWLPSMSYSYKISFHYARIITLYNLLKCSYSWKTNLTYNQIGWNFNSKANESYCLQQWTTVLTLCPFEGLSYAPKSVEKKLFENKGQQTRMETIQKGIVSDHWF